MDYKIFVLFTRASNSISSQFFINYKPNSALIWLISWNQNNWIRKNAALNQWSCFNQHSFLQTTHLSAITNLSDPRQQLSSSKKLVFDSSDIKIKIKSGKSNDRDTQSECTNKNKSPIKLNKQTSRQHDADWKQEPLSPLETIHCFGCQYNSEACPTEATDIWVPLRSLEGF